MQFIALVDRWLLRTLKFRHVRYRAIDGSRCRSASACRVRDIRAVCAADLLGVSSRDRIDLKRRIAGRQSTAASDSPDIADAAS
jgi:hypothetical protein